MPADNPTPAITLQLTENRCTGAMGLCRKRKFYARLNDAMRRELRAKGIEPPEDQYVCFGTVCAARAAKVIRGMKGVIA